MPGSTVTNVLSEVKETIKGHESKVDSNLEWLQQAMHPFFFNFNQDEIESLAVLASALNRIHRLPYLRLTDTPERLLLAQASHSDSLYETLSIIKRRENLSYSEINTSFQKLPGNDEYLEILRFDYNRKSDADIATLIENDAATDLPSSIMKEVEAELSIHAPDFNKDDLESLLKLLWLNNPTYVQVSHPERIARMIHLYQQTKFRGGIHLDINPISTPNTDEKARVLFGVSNPPQHNFFMLQVMEVFRRLKIKVRRSYTVTISNGVYPNFLATFYVSPLDDSSLEPGSERFKELQHELYNTQILSSSSGSFDNLVANGLMNGPDASLVKAMITFVHTNLAHNNPERFAPDVIQRAFHNHPDVSTHLVRLFHARFKPELEDREAIYDALLEQATEMVDNFNTGRRFLDQTRRTVFQSAISFITNCLKTNFFVQEKHALAFRLDPAYLEELDAEFTSDLPVDRPFRITFFSGRSGSGYHIGFSDIARGGWRTLITQGHDDYVNSANTLFKENYVLAHTQHLKNKDIYEGGSKMVAILNTRPDTPRPAVLQYLYKLQFGFIHAFLDLYITENGKAKDPAVVDYYGEDEPIELGPDENMHDVMIELIAQQAADRGYVLGTGVMSSKKVGINHKDYGVTSIGVIRFAEVTMKEVMGIDMHKDEFSVKFTGGPNGDVAGNGMRLLLERCPQVQVRLIIDGSGAIFDPIGLDRDALSAIVLQSDLDAYDSAALNPGGYIIYRNQQRTEGIRTLYKKLMQTESGLEEHWISTDEFYKTYNNLVFSVEADLFIPAGGRPETIAAHNVDQFFNNEGNPSANVIVEGANSFITPDARIALQNRGVVIMRDASANKCGVISSSYEIIANLMLSTEEFLSNKERYVSDVIDILNRMAEQEANLIIKRHRLAGDSLVYTEISNQLSHEINSHYSKMFSFFQSKPELIEDERYRTAMLQHMPVLLSENETFRQRLDQLPDKVKYAILASKLASGMVYFSDDNAVYEDIIEAQLGRLTGS
uniref:Glu/Leu/Phe/Val dehydrogenase family protein n=1 Tax=uncultured Thiotrichaceae bacterium TaxID=298394 RepID=A0A6S6TRI6_9GAMM|nr:MAG: Glu/Leu/Phe/Val dehydrogenase family protein [uncultured Thiotrichaceae bacterium]